TTTENDTPSTTTDVEVKTETVQENEVTTPSSAKEEIKETPKEEVKETPKQEVDLTEDDKQTISYLMETTLSATFGSENCEVYYDEEHGWFQVNIIYDGAAVMVVGVQQDSSLRGQWETDVLDSMVALNLSMKDLLVTLGHDDVSVVLTLLNDLNTDNVLVGIMDGVVILDATEQ
ncbi:MAG: hypothetical protein IIZ99_03920, partial [Turicibacter sp.]|nr:hypothetical protein [Turicibacter sp.]